MARANTIQTNFTAGEISPRLKGRVDLNKYQNGAQKVLNFIIKPQGGLFARSGTKFIREVKDSTRKGILVEFEFSDTQAYMLEFGHNVVRVFKDEQIVMNGLSPLEIVSPYSESELPNLGFTQSADVLYITHPAHEPLNLNRIGELIWTFTVIPFTDGPYMDQNKTDTSMIVSGLADVAALVATVDTFVVGDVGKFAEYFSEGVIKLALITAYVNARQVTVTPKDNIKYTVTSDQVNYDGSNINSGTAIFADSDVGSYVHTSAGTWHLTTGFIDEQTMSANAAETVMSTSTVVSLINRVTTATVAISSSSVVVLTDVGRHLRLNFSSKQVWGKITAVDSGLKSVSVTFYSPVPRNAFDSTQVADGGTTTLWRLGAWSQTTGYPSAVTFHEERLWFGGSPEQPQTFWGSVSGDYVSMSPTDPDSKVLDDNALTYTIGSNKVNVIKWFASGPVLLLGTLGATWQIAASSAKEAITPTNISVTPQAAYGSSSVRPLRVGEAVLFVQRAGTKIRELVYDYQLDAIVAKDVTIISEHIVRRGIKAVAVAYQQEPNSVFWVVLQNGTLAAMTYVRDQEVYAWHQHIIGGSFGAGNAVVESIACVPKSSGNDDVLYMIVKRTINGTTKRYIEFLTPEVDPSTPTDKNNLVYVDCCASFSGIAPNQIPFSHLQGQLCQVFGDGSVRNDTVATAGGADVSGTGITTGVAGLPYPSTLQMLNPEGGAQFGTSQGKLKRIHKSELRVHKSMGFLQGPDEDNLKEYSFRKTTSPMDRSPDLRSEIVDFSFDESYDRDGSMTVKRIKPYPLNILSVMHEFITNDD